MKRTHYFALLWILLCSIPQGIFAQIKVLDPTKDTVAQVINRATPEFRYYYQIKNGADTAINDLMIMVSPFLSENSGERAVVEMKINDKPVAGSTTQGGDKYGTYSYGPFALKAKESLGLELNAHLIQPGNHYGKLIFLSGGVSEEKALKVRVKTDSSLSFSLGNIATSRNVVNPFSGRAEFWISIINESSFPQSVRFPDIKDLVKVIAEDENIDPSYSSILFNDTNGELLNEKGLIELTAGGSKRIKMSIKGLKEPGKYSGTLRMNSSMGTSVQEKSFTVLVKHGWFMASLMILLGVIASTYLKNYLSKIRPRLEVNKRIGTAEQSLKELQEKYAEADAGTLKILKLIGSDIASAKEAAESGQGAEVASIVGIARKKMTLLPEWKEGVDRASDHHLAKFVKAETQADLRFLETILLKAKPTPEEFKKCDTSLANVEENLNKLIPLVPFHERLDHLEAALATASQLTHIDKARLDTLKGARMAKVKENMEAQRLNEMEKLMDKMERELGGLVLSAKMKFVQGMIDTLKDKSKKLTDKEAIKAAKAGLEGLDKGMLEVREALNSGRFKEGEDMVKNLAQEVKRMSPGDFHTDRSVGSGLSPETLILGDLDAPTAIESGLEKLILKPDNYDPESIDRRIRNNDLIVTAIIAVVALLGGLKLLWAEDLTWGSPTDYLTALLWGLGLHQAGTGGIFNGLGSVQNRLLGGGAPAPAPIVKEEEA